VALTVADLQETDHGFLVTIRRSKTDQEGQGQQVAILHGCRICPVAAVKAWLSARASRRDQKGGCLSSSSGDTMCARGYPETVAMCFLKKEAESFL
jgi:hypothetical protein